MARQKEPQKPVRVRAPTIPQTTERIIQPINKGLNKILNIIRLVIGVCFQLSILAGFTSCERFLDCFGDVVDYFFSFIQFF
ncbi:hypothetical protein CLV42_11636 [Chitinophaga ginsengisoli]|uniref:Uncharacterized protein n=1 Tax=Chitinophaga ginsengisoli TaxID=363837 RepID=A0A2P8FQP5_9BACT|nr:hypothetical protein CLV42_11636 [Chitinophaga ginsengisoli]